MFRNILPTSWNEDWCSSVVSRIYIYLDNCLAMVLNIFPDVMFYIFQGHLIVSLYLFVYAKMALKKIPLYNDIQSRISSGFLLIPLYLFVAVALVCDYIHINSPIILSVIILPMAIVHMFNEPAVLKRYVSTEDMRDSSCRRIFSLAKRVRIYLMASILYLSLSYYAFLNLN